MMNMKRIVDKLWLMAVLLVLTGCEKELMNYEGADCLYFDVRSAFSSIDESLWPHEYFSTVAFGSTMDNDIVLTCKVMASGYPKDYDRTFQITANPDSTTAVVGRDYDGLENSYTIKAGEMSATVKLTVHRSPEMADDTLRLQLMLHENEYFKLLYVNYEDFEQAYEPTHHKLFSQNHNAAYHNIWLYDVMVQPKGWWAGLFGPFSAKKWQLMMKVTNTEMVDYDTMATMPQMRAEAINESFGEYLLEQAKSRETVILENDGTMMWVKAVNTLGGARGWDKDTKPADYYGN